VGLWRRLAALSTEVGFFRQAIYCLCKVIHRAREDMEALWDRAVLYAEIGETRR
jgi:general transcription factor 3C polypeptide 3 (transcription factor C subunit 4)